MIGEIVEIEAIGFTSPDEVLIEDVGEGIIKVRQLPNETDFISSCAVTRILTQ
ncbi:hypothetical protein [Chengkuizengella axinellae]|uniref:Uncharacterized protein n=1 Tax=Chengkuizengella axinellae TaxID=3064388 RepID=A0ABT9J0J3_9BACL|nr:hypothetical protein [Chengkuizengella sp. 2205SS18-9]MDP5275097.1 hypothetical protein [Chengkuizengella sp. 2205SS18-9]